MSDTTREIAATIRDQCLGRRLRQVSRQVTGVYNKALRDLGVTLSQLNILVALVSLGEASPGRVSQALSLEKSTTSRTISRMVEVGWVSVVSTRPQRLSVTRSGERLLEQAYPRWQQAQAEVESVLGRQPVLAVSRRGQKLGHD